MNELGKDHIPITGSAAALHRKQQLEYQVPPHDLNPNLCHNLTNAEKKLFEEHIAKIVCNSGQGFVTRLLIQRASKTQINNPAGIDQICEEKLESVPIENKPYIESIKNDKVLQKILCSELIKGIKHSAHHDDLINRNMAISQTNKTCSNVPDFIESPLLSLSTKEKLIPMKINSEAIQSAVLNGWYYDNLLQDLDKNKIDYTNDLVLNPIKAFRTEYKINDLLKKDVDKFAIDMGGAILAPIINVQNDSLQMPCNNYNSENNILEQNDKPPEINYLSHPHLSKLSKENVNIDPTNVLLNQFKPLQIDNSNYVKNMKDSNYYPDLIEKEHTSNELENLNIYPQYMPSIFCRSCKLQISSNDIVVQTHKNDKQVAWHPKCFTCFSCNELLADLVYFSHKGNIYCARDYAAILNIPRCKACDELIFTKEYTVAENASYHVRHFCCFHCDTPLANQNYVSDDRTGQPLCLPCYENYQAEKCQSCKKPIGANEQGVAWSSLHWHTYCFNCAGKNCNKHLLGGRFLVKNNFPLCSTECFKSLNI